MARRQRHDLRYADAEALVEIPPQRIAKGKGKGAGGPRRLREKHGQQQGPREHEGRVAPLSRLVSMPVNGGKLHEREQEQEQNASQQGEHAAQGAGGSLRQAEGEQYGAAEGQRDMDGGRRRGKSVYDTVCGARRGSRRRLGNFLFLHGEQLSFQLSALLRATRQKLPPAFLFS